jgi:hypothetical protein
MLRLWRSLQLVILRGSRELSTGLLLLMIPQGEITQHEANGKEEPPGVR